MDINSYIKKLRALPEKQKKIILWTIVVVVAMGMVFFWFKVSIKRLEKLEESVKKIDIPSIEIKNIEEISDTENPK